MSTTGPYSTPGDTQMADSTSVHQTISYTSVPGYATIHDLNPTFDHLQIIPYGETSSHCSLITHQESPRQTRSIAMDDMYQDTSVQHAEGQQSLEQIPANTEMDQPLVPAPLEPSSRKRKSWMLAACRMCIEAKHSIEHQRIRGVAYRGKSAHNCKENECRRMISALWHTNFERSEDCSHYNKQLSHISRPLAGSLKSLATKTIVPRPQTKIIKLNFDASRILRGRFTKRTRTRSTSRVTEQTAEPVECIETPIMQSHLPNPTTGGVPEVNTGVLLCLESGNGEILQTYPGRVMSEGLVENSWLRLINNISAYDNYVRGVTSTIEVRTKLEVLDSIAPLSELPEIKLETEFPEKFGHQSTQLLLVLKSMFNVQAHTCLCSVINLVLAKQEVFLVKENESFWSTFEEGLREICGEQGSEILQYCLLKTLKLDSTKSSIERRVQRLAESIYATIIPLSHWVEDSPNNSRAKHLELLGKITRQSLRLATELQARQGTFKFLWPGYGVFFDPDLYAVDASQADDFQKMDDKTREKQLVAFTLMPAVQIVLPEEENALTYARGVVLLKVPYVDYHHGEYLAPSEAGRN